MDEQNIKEAITRSLFDEPVDLFNYSQFQPVQSYARMIQASRSVPGSRRNSNDDHSLDLLLGKKLSLNDREPSFINRKLPFSMTPIDPIGSNKRQSQLIDNTSTESDIPLFNPLLPAQNDSHLHHLTSTSTHHNLPTCTNENELFTMTHIDHNPIHHINPIEQPHWQPSIIGQHESNLDGRRYSYGWHTNPNRSQSYTDLASLSFLKQKKINCPNHQEFGYCERQAHCPFQHPIQYQPSYHNHHHQIPLHNKVKKFDLIQRRPEQQDKFSEATIEDYRGKLYELCKDQNGCRFLQRKMDGKEDGKNNLDLIFLEIHTHFIELMTDPFGNYLCQKMLEKCSDEQRTAIIKVVAPEVVHIALNMHGTRAVQKLIECLLTPEQVQLIINALNSNVVTLIKDLNGNHVIQKCLSLLSSENNQFIYDAVCKHCIEVASHKHGCCVLQRCFDHATVQQKDQLVNEVSKHALPLVQDAFGNYVVQYVLELGVDRYSESIISRFVNHVYILSVQKFSSNVIENCIRTANPSTRRLLIAELINPVVMEKLLHDSFANYVVQTSLDFADEDQRTQLVECIKPLLPSIRTTPYGKRIHSKIFRENKKIN